MYRWRQNVPLARLCTLSAVRFLPGPPSFTFY
jgi:hypothetical protein